MKIVKYLFLLIILGLLGTLIYQNLDYFMTTAGLHLDLKISTWHWSAPELTNIAYWGICLGLGLLITGIKGMFTGFRLGREIKEKDAAITTLKAEINALKVKLDVFTHDPYIKKEPPQLSSEPDTLAAASENAGEDAPKTSE